MTTETKFSIDYVPVTTCKAALERSTEQQGRAIERIMESYRANAIQIYVDSSLPNGYLGFAVDAKGGSKLFGGIAPDGSVSM